MEIPARGPDQILFSKNPEQTTVLLKKLIKDEVNVDYEALSNVVVAGSDTFKKRFAATPETQDPKEIQRQEAELDRWVESQEGHKTLENLTGNCLSIISDQSYNGPPAHDRTHFLKSLYSGIVTADEDSYPPSVRKAAILATVMHDVGRSLEVAIAGEIKPGHADYHAKIGCFMIEKILECYPTIPTAFSDQILYAILSHPEGKTLKTVSRIVQRADREQLVGAEGVRRIIIAGVAMEGRNIHTKIDEKRKAELPPPAGSEDTQIMPLLEFYIRNLYPNIGSHGEERANELKAETGIFLWLAASDEIREQIFAPEIKRDKGKKVGKSKLKKTLSQEVWDRIKIGPTGNDRIRMEGYSNLSLEEIVVRFITRKGTCLSGQSKKGQKTIDVIPSLKKQLGELSEAERVRLKDAFAFGLVKIEDGEKEMVETAGIMANSNLEGTPERQTAELIFKSFS